MVDNMQARNTALPRFAPGTTLPTRPDPALRQRDGMQIAGLVPLEAMLGRVVRGERHPQVGSLARALQAGWYLLVLSTLVGGAAVAVCGAVLALLALPAILPWLALLSVCGCVVVAIAASRGA